MKNPLNRQSVLCINKRRENCDVVVRGKGTMRNVANEKNLFFNTKKQRK
jgi:hypothetical protein